MGEAALITGLAGATEDEGVETPTARTRRRLLSRKGAAFGLFVIALLVALALLAPLISPYDPNLQTWSAVRKAPSALHWFGTDDVGRDVLARVIYGARASLLAGVISVAIALLVGVPIGIISGYVGGFVDALFGPRRRHHRRSVVVFSGPWSTASRALVGQHAQFRPAFPRQRALDGGLAGACNFSCCSCLQLGRRRPARRARSALALIVPLRSGAFSQSQGQRRKGSERAKCLPT